MALQRVARKGFGSQCPEAKQHTKVSSTLLFPHAILNLFFVPITINVRHATFNGAHNAVSRIHQATSHDSGFRTNLDEVLVVPSVEDLRQVYQTKTEAFAKDRTDRAS